MSVALDPASDTADSSHPFQRPSLHFVHQWNDWNPQGSGPLCEPGLLPNLVADTDRRGLQNGGHAVASRYAVEHTFGLTREDTIFTASDLGWVVGHSFCVYAPLLVGAASVIFEGKPILPDAGIFWKSQSNNHSLAPILQLTSPCSC